MIHVCTMYVKMFLVSFQSYNSFPLDSVKPTEVLYVIGVKGAKRKNKNFISLYQRNGIMVLLLLTSS